MYFACFRHRSNCIPIKGVALASFFTHRSSLCSFYSFSITCFRVPLSTRALSQPSKTARWREITAMTSRIAERFGILCGVVWLQSSLAPGWPSTLMFLARRSVKRMVGWKDGYGILCCRSLIIAFRCSFARCLCPSMCSPGRLDSS